MIVAVIILLMSETIIIEKKKRKRRNKKKTQTAGIVVQSGSNRMFRRVNKNTRGDRVPVAYGVPLGPNKGGQKQFVYNQGFQTIRNRTNRRGIRNLKKQFVSSSSKPLPSVNPATIAYMDGVCNPFDCQSIAKMPDLDRRRSVTLMDYVEPSLFSISADTTQMGSDTHAYGVVIMFMYGFNNLYNYDDGTYNGFYGWNYPANPVPPYGFVAWIVDSAGHLVPANTTGPGPNYIQPVNIENIMGSLDIDPDIRVDNPGLADLFRMLFCGLRVLPQNEILTDSSTIGMEAIFGANVVFNNVINNFYLATSPQPIDAFITGFETRRFSNEEGCCVRLNPFQKGLCDFHDYSDTIGTYTGVSPTSSALLTQTYNYGNNTTPMLYLKFNQQIAYTSITSDVATYTLPFYFDARLALEVVPTMPTPLVGQESPVDPKWTMIRELMQVTPEAMCPFVTKGHSFKSMYDNVGKFLNFANKFFTFGTAAIGPLGQVYKSASAFL